MQVWVSTGVPLPDAFKREVRQQFFEVRKRMRGAILKNVEEDSVSVFEMANPQIAAQIKTTPRRANIGFGMD